MPTVWYNAQLQKKSEQAGFYYLKDGTRSECSVYDYEKGIVINDDIYLTLNFPSRDLTSAEAQTFCKIKGGRIPDEYELWQIQQSLDKIRRALAGITFPEQKLPDDVMHCWSVEKISNGWNSFSYPLLLIDGNPHNPKDTILIRGYFVLLNNQDLFVKKDKTYVPAQLELWAVTGDKTLLALRGNNSDVDLFECTAESKLSHLGNYLYIGQDIFMGAGSFYQYYNGEMRLFCKEQQNSYYLRGDTFEVRYTNTWMSGLTQEMHDDFATDYKRDSQGLWQENKHYDFGFVRQY